MIVSPFTFHVSPFTLHSLVFAFTFHPSPFTFHKGLTMKRAHKNLDVWKESMELATAVYRVTGTFPKAETYGLAGQMRRAAVSVPSNIAEGAARSPKEFAQFLTIAGGSLSELDTQLEIAFRLNYLTGQHHQELQTAMESIAIKLAGLISHVRRKAT